MINLHPRRTAFIKKADGGRGKFSTLLLLPLDLAPLPIFCYLVWVVPLPLLSAYCPSSCVGVMAICDFLTRLADVVVSVISSRMAMVTLDILSQSASLARFHLDNQDF